jgi:hypothetical protein
MADMMGIAWREHSTIISLLFVEGVYHDRNKHVNSEKNMK